MRAITLHQPYATLIAVGIKTIETRSWFCRPGELAIHAAKRIMGDDGLHIANVASRVHSFAMCYPRGAVLATCRIDECIPTDVARDLYPEQIPWGNFDNGRWAWIIKDVKQLNPQVPCRGFQRFFEVEL